MRLQYFAISRFKTHLTSHSPFASSHTQLLNHILSIIEPPAIVYERRSLSHTSPDRVGTLPFAPA